jgi:HEAT repeat protein
MRAWVACLIAGLGLAGSAPAAEITNEHLFVRTATLEGRAYAVGRGLLERQGKDLLPLLKARRDRASYRERLLAEALRLRVEDPAKAAGWLRALNWYPHKFTYRDDGTVLVEFDPQEAEALGKAGKPVPPEKSVVFDRSAVPFLLDVLWECVEDVGRGGNQGSGWDRGLALLKHFADPESVPSLLAFHGRIWNQSQSDLFVEIIARVGQPALPHLRRAVQDAAIDLPQGNDSEEQQRVWREIHVSPGAARALARIGDPEGAAILADKLAKVRAAAQVEGFAAALARMRSDQGLPVVFDRLVREADNPKNSGSWDTPDYLALRQALLSYGDKARDFLRPRTANEQGLATRALAVGLLYELENPAKVEEFYKAVGAASLEVERVRADRGQDKVDLAALGRSRYWFRGWQTPPSGPTAPPPLLIERGPVFAAGPDLQLLARQGKDPLAFAVVREALLHHRLDGDPSVDIVLGLAESGEVRTLEVYEKVLEQDRGHPALYLALTEGAVLLDDEKAVPLLEAILPKAASARGDPQALAAQALVRAALPAFKGDRTKLVDLLGHDHPVVRRAAARCLARKNDRRSVPVLIDLAVAANGREHAELMVALVGLGRTALDELKKRSDDANVLVRVVSEAALLSITRPEVAAKFAKAAAVRPRGFDSHAGPSLEDYRAAGKELAAAVGQEGLPLVEEGVAFDVAPGANIALFALVDFKAERSLGLLEKSFGRFGSVRGHGLLAAALNDFGPKGVELAKRVPAPDPNKENFDSRAGRHRAATETLVEAKDPEGIDNILKSLEALKDPAGADLPRVGSYLRLAKKYDDKRIVEPALRLAGLGNPELRVAALDVLAGYEDPRLVTLATEYLGVDAKWGYDDPALRLLVRQLGGDVVPRLAKQMREDRDASHRQRAAQALANLHQHGHYYWSVRYKEQADQSQAATKLLEGAYQPALEALKDGNEGVQKQAAELLALMGPHLGRGPEMIQELTKWAKTQTDLPAKVVVFLGAYGDAEAGHVLLKLYRDGGRRDGELAQALGQLRFKPAIPELVRALEELPGNGQPSTLLGALADMGADGLKEIRRFLQKENPPDWADQAALTVGTRGDPDAFDGIARLYAATAVEMVRLAGARGAERRERLQRLGYRLMNCADGLSGSDAKRAYPLLCSGAFSIPDPGTRSGLFWRVARMEEAKPELKRPPVTLTDYAAD